MDKLFKAFCILCKKSRGYKRKDRLYSLCRKCGRNQATEVLREKNRIKDIKNGFSVDSILYSYPNGRKRLKYRMFCKECGKDKGYVLKSSKGKRCAQCAANKGGLVNKGLVPPNKGKSCSKEQRIKISCTKQGILVSEFSGFVTPIDQQLRTIPLMTSLKKDCYRRDNYTCNICKIKGGILNAHHMNGWKDYLEDRYSINNLITLCEKCHKEYHKINGKKNNTKEQYNTYKEIIDGKKESNE